MSAPLAQPWGFVENNPNPSSAPLLALSPASLNSFHTHSETASTSWSAYFSSLSSHPPPLASSKLAGVGDVGTAAWWGGRAKDRDGAVLSLVMKVGLRQEDRLKAWVSWCEAAGGIGGRESVAAIEKKVAASMKSGDYGPLEFADASLVRTIDVDLQRTLTDHPQFKEGGGAEMLKRVLLCTALTVPDVGYLQGMNFLGAFLHLTFPEATSQELVLVLSTMVTKVLPG
jgi:hypothetical protein